MIDLPDYESMIDALSRPIDPGLHTLLAGRLKDTIALGLQDLTHILVVEPDDTEAQIIEAIGFSPLVSRIDGICNHPDWDWIEFHAGWIELVYTVGDSGFAYILFVADGGSDLATLCQQHNPTLSAGSET